MKKKKARPAPPHRNLRTPFRITSEEHELIAREAFDFGPVRPGLAPISYNEWLCMTLFKPGWKKRLKALRAKQRVAGVADERFLHRSEKEARGMQVKPGRAAWRMEMAV